MSQTVRYDAAALKETMEERVDQYKEFRGNLFVLKRKMVYDRTASKLPVFSHGTYIIHKRNLLINELNPGLRNVGVDKYRNITSATSFCCVDDYYKMMDVLEEQK
ncbi:hypothetical protein P6709_06825 [Jeotgalibacillus sp. ET6]|uniref:hypothetical protein n=1 Tax=Jeotgalibacillus sp. ET6 TaxID=3037260 RepID=UPI0024184E4D|nr:hypothetical protein [Jeotgalibacillus sp. ET6]MDG5471455.1 hypothetical protein [Jeotgalibacillus sp. ET6]